MGNRFVGCRHEDAIGRRSMLLGLAALAGALRPAGAAEMRVTAEQALTTFKAVPKVLWVWREGLLELPAIASFMSRWGFNIALYSMPPDERAALNIEASSARAAFASFRQAGLKLLLVAGDPTWARNRDGGTSPLPPAVATLLELASRAGPVDGIAVDIEPHTLPDWRTERRSDLARGFEAVLHRIKLECAHRSMPLWAALHPSQAATPDPAGRRSNLAAAALEHLDGAVVMAYRNRTDQAVDFAKGLTTALAATNVSWYFGVTTQGGPEGAEISYHGFDPTQFATAVTDLHESFWRATSRGRYRGIAIHQFSTIGRLLP